MEDKSKDIFVSKSYLPPLNEYVKYLEGIWKSGHLTNNGPLLVELESQLKKYLNVKHLFIVGNGTIALQIAIKSLDLKNEIITTPFSYVATASSIVWEGCQPVFADIESNSLNIDPKSVKDKITEKTTAILATHVYGNPCKVDEIAIIAKQNNLKIIYDSAHAFGTKYNGRSLLEYGDVSTLSFHATKLFHTVEGGAIITNDDEVAHRISYMRSFGHNGPVEFFGIGINGKNSEFHAAMGLCILPKISYQLENRKYISALYDNHLANTWHILDKPSIIDGSDCNNAYYPLILPSESKLLSLIEDLNNNNIFPRRYFYPSLNKLSYIETQSCPISESLSTQVLCLPLYNDLTEHDIVRICGVIKSNLLN